MADQEFHTAGRFPKLLFLAKFVQNWLFSWDFVYISSCFKMEEGFWKVGSSSICPCLTSGTLKRTLFF